MRTLTLHDSITSSATSSAIDVSRAKGISLQCIGETVTSGSCTFAVTISNDGSNFTTYSKLISNSTNTNSQNLTRVASLILSSATTDYVFIDPADVFKYMKVSATITGNGTYEAVLAIDEQTL